MATLPGSACAVPATPATQPPGHGRGRDPGPVFGQGPACSKALCRKAGSASAPGLASWGARRGTVPAVQSQRPQGSRPWPLWAWAPGDSRDARSLRRPPPARLTPTSSSRG